MLEANRQVNAFRWALAGLCAVSLGLAGCSGGEQTADTPAPAAQPPPSPMAGMTGFGGMQGDGGQQAQQAPSPAANQAAPAPGALAANAAPAPGYRKDPFAPWWPPPPPPPAIGLVEPMRLATTDSAATDPAEPITVHEVSNRRVSGILTGAGVFASLEGPDGNMVVRPGDAVGDYNVENITSNSVTLKRVVGVQTFIQEIPLSDVGAASRPATAAFRPSTGGAGPAPGLRGGRGGALGADDDK